MLAREAGAAEALPPLDAVFIVKVSCEDPEESLSAAALGISKLSVAAARGLAAPVPDVTLFTNCACRVRLRERAADGEVVADEDEPGSRAARSAIGLVEPP